MNRERVTLDLISRLGVTGVHDDKLKYIAAGSLVAAKYENTPKLATIVETDLDLLLTQDKGLLTALHVDHDVSLRYALYIRQYLPYRLEKDEISAMAIGMAVWKVFKVYPVFHPEEWQPSTDSSGLW
ncbi:hypothetical protein PsorP6_000707 [Peronosclerospora sorghi]|uniref:Uncharacterized protein n=1 Tax=Peronosclerospora sorghi TaxID=230839 RepID=A0ACC0WZZ2_9STRA|nr:hypothetical protein PsorP6_000707 [Peronosclerospora sorghi]